MAYGRKRARPSASYAPRKFTRRTRTTRGRKNQVRRRRAYGRYATRPSRFRVRSASGYSRTRKAASLLSLVGETKFQGFNSQGVSGSFGTENLTPQSKPGGTQPISYIFMNAGGQMSATQNPTQWLNMNLFTFPQGDTKTERDGDYLYLKGSTGKIQIQMLGAANTGAAGAGANQGLNTPVRFRAMIIKANRKNSPLGVSPALNSTLFLDTQNGNFGPDSTTSSPYQYMHAPINTRNWLTYMDTSFTLSPSAVDFNDQSTGSSINTADQKYPSCKNMSFKFPVNKKTHFQNASNQPDSIDTQWMFILQAVNTGYTLANSANWGIIGQPRNFRVQCLATTTALDA